MLGPLGARWLIARDPTTSTHRPGSAVSGVSWTPSVIDPAARECPQPLVELALLGLEPLGDTDLDVPIEIAAPAPAEHWQSLASQTQPFARLGPRRDHDLDRAVKRRHLDLGAQHRVGLASPAPRRSGKGFGG